MIYFIVFDSYRCGGKDFEAFVVPGFVVLGFPISVGLARLAQLLHNAISAMPKVKSESFFRVFIMLMFNR